MPLASISDNPSGSNLKNDTLSDSTSLLVALIPHEPTRPVRLATVATALSVNYRAQLRRGYGHGAFAHLPDSATTVTVASAVAVVILHTHATV